MSADYARAFPTKRFFIEMLTRDIALEDALLDLIDNCIDGYCRTTGLSLSSSLITANGSNNGNYHVNLELSDNKFVIDDNCGGIDFEEARNNVFRFGRIESHAHSGLSVYGIGLKRAIFKIGKQIEIISRTVNNGFKLVLNTDDWLGEGDNTNWQFPLEKIDPADSAIQAGTTILITQIRPEIETRLRDRTVENQIIKSISEAYPLFLNSHISIYVNGHKIVGKRIVFAESDNLTAAREMWTDDGVFIELFCGLRPKDDPAKGQWKTESAGWFVVCNGRVVVSANKDTLTGWGIQGDLPEFQPKHRGFTGIVFFSSQDHQEKLPWNTTKRGLNQESLIYLRTRQKMITHGREVVKFLDKVYTSNDNDTPLEAYRAITDNAKEVNVAAEAEEKRKENKAERNAFSYSTPSVSIDPSTSIQFTVKNSDLEKVRSRLKKRSMSAKAIGEHTFNYFLKRECE